MNHETVLAVLKRSIADAGRYDRNLCDYLLRDVVNAATGNTDNHGRNTSIMKRGGELGLSPAYDIAPMVMDDEGISPATVWSGKYQNGNEDPNYSAIILEFAVDASLVLSNFQAKLTRLCCLEEIARELGLPTPALRHRKVDLRKPEKVLGNFSHESRKM